MKKQNLWLAVLLIVFASSCVPVRHYEDMKKKFGDCDSEREAMKQSNKTLGEQVAELQSQVEELTKKTTMLVNDTSIMGRSYRILTQQYDKINTLNDELMKKLKMKNIEMDNESRKLYTELQGLKEDLQAKEDELKKLEKDLNTKKSSLDKLQSQLEEKDKDLIAKSARLMELEAMLSKKDSTVNALKEKVMKALKGFEGQGLTIETRNGKVYVSMEEKLLFKSGSWVVDPKGQNAIKEIAKVLEQNPDINVMIEGHTDDVPYKGSGGVEDNWDLSAKRATAIVKIITSSSKVEPSRLIAAGRSEYVPVDKSKTADARAKNRRTEIILTPKLDELFKMMESN
jgi:chemotaxis protein MotB